MTETNTVRGTTVGRVALRVNDLDRTSSFYEQVVGLEPQSKGDQTAALGAGGVPLLELVEDADAPERTRDETGLFHTAFLVPSRRALADALVRLEDEWELTGASDHRVSEALYCRDPEGNGIELYRDRPREAWPIGDDGRVQMDTLPLDTNELRKEATETETVPSNTVVGHVHLEVSSIAAAREFYADALGMNVRQEYGPSALFLAADDYHHHVGCNVWNNRTKPADGRGLEWFELAVPNRETLETVRERFAAREISVTEIEDGIEITDSDEITVRLRAHD
ncbi:catechol 2,3-dioxygenase [Haladaptatus litoreus]|uniref:Catechol 2,3-dioxygenase n=1 Tax=Haladaptatus litoreus TaxID=553468 RepID=A0A1N6XVQ8_9EURY|nr:VOC family protein [Haladaptatus litoreus]SIR06448.1 catechol 2,3-dioxygenase [Haladaptatus litoreus]